MYNEKPKKKNSLSSLQIKKLVTIVHYYLPPIGHFPYLHSLFH